MSEFKYLGVMLDSTLTFKKHVKKRLQTQSSSTFRTLNKSDLSWPLVLLNLISNALILSHIEYCFTNWSQTCTGLTTLKPIEQLYKSVLKVFDRKPHSYHHCNIFHKYSILNTRAITRGDCEVPYRATAFGKNTLSVQGCSIWNDLPLTIRDCLSFPSFKFNLKKWLVDNQTCDHV